MATCISKQALKKGNIKQGNGNKCKESLTLPGGGDVEREEESPSTLALAFTAAAEGRGN